MRPDEKCPSHCATYNRGCYAKISKYNRPKFLSVVDLDNVFVRWRCCIAYRIFLKVCVEELDKKFKCFFSHKGKHGLSSKVCDSIPQNSHRISSLFGLNFIPLSVVPLSKLESLSDNDVTGKNYNPCESSGNSLF